MARAVCNHCNRPQKVCICEFIEPVQNRVEIGVLQHPSEVAQIKGTAIIAQLALSHCHLWVGEGLCDLPELQAWLNNGVQTLLLYPPTDEQESGIECQLFKPTDLNFEQAPFKVLVLDGTWRKTYKMMQLNPELKALNRIGLEPTNPSAYKVRKQKDESSLSTIEAIAELLAQIEGHAEPFKGLLNAFNKIQNQQMAFRNQAPGNSV